MINNNSKIENGSALSPSDTLGEDQNAVTTSKAHYEAPELITHGRLSNLTLTLPTSGGTGDTGGI